MLGTRAPRPQSRNYYPSQIRNGAGEGARVPEMKTAAHLDGRFRIRYVYSIMALRLAGDIRSP